MHLGKSLEDYLEAIYILSQKCPSIRSIDIAKYLKVSKPSVCHAVKLLKSKEYIEKDTNNYLYLTIIGKKYAAKIYEKHCFLQKMLISAGVNEKDATHDACQMEHSISDESFEKLKKLYSDKI